MKPFELHNIYFALRHGESMANARGVIVSRLGEGKKLENTLTKNGEDQVLLSMGAAKKQWLLDSEVIIYSSPFSRCMRTAEIAKDVLGTAHEIIFDDRLRERWFGEWEGTSNDNYQKVWNRDAHNVDHGDADVESAVDVAKRAISVIDDLEKTYSDKKILLVSHGDVLRILQTFFEDASPGDHRSVKSLETAEFRQLNK